MLRAHNEGGTCMHYDKSALQCYAGVHTNRTCAGHLGTLSRIFPGDGRIPHFVTRQQNHVQCLYGAVVNTCDNAGSVL